MIRPLIRPLLTPDDYLKKILNARVYDVANRQNSLDQYSYKPERGYQVTIKVRF